eukprot:EG_transcript_42742
MCFALSYRALPSPLMFVIDTALQYTHPVPPDGGTLWDVPFPVCEPLDYPLSHNASLTVPTTHLTYCPTTMLSRQVLCPRQLSALTDDACLLWRSAYLLLPLQHQRNWHSNTG